MNVVVHLYECCTNIGSYSVHRNVISKVTPKVARRRVDFMPRLEKTMDKIIDLAKNYRNYGNTRYDEEKRIIWRDLLLPVPDDPSKKVEMGRILCPILLIVGEDDQNWPASESAEDMKQMMEQAGNSHLLTTLSYPGAGHLIEPPYSPHCRASNYMLIGTRKKVVVLWGGQTVPHSHAQEDSWHKTLAFLEQHLYSNESH